MPDDVDHALECAPYAALIERAEDRHGKHSKEVKELLCEMREIILALDEPPV